MWHNNQHIWKLKQNWNVKRWEKFYVWSIIHQFSNPLNQLSNSFGLNKLETLCTFCALCLLFCRKRSHPQTFRGRARSPHSLRFRGADWEQPVHRGGPDNGPLLPAQRTQFPRTQSGHHSRPVHRFSGANPSDSAGLSWPGHPRNVKIGEQAEGSICLLKYQELCSHTQCTHFACSLTATWSSKTWTPSISSACHVTCLHPTPPTGSGWLKSSSSTL